MSPLRRGKRIISEQAAAKFRDDVLYTLGQAITTWGTNDRTYDAKELGRQVKKAGP